MYADRQAVNKKDARTVLEACPARGTLDVSITDILSNWIESDQRQNSRQGMEKLDERLYNIIGITADEIHEEGLHDEPFDVFISFLSFVMRMHACRIRDLINTG